MKPLWKKPIALPALSNRIEADLGPHRVTVRRSPWPYRAVSAVVSEQVAAAAGQPAWRSAIEMLDRTLKDWSPVNGDLRVTLSNRFARYLLVPAHPDLKRQDELTEYARHFFVGRFGIEAENWTIRLSPCAQEGQLFACAIEGGLVDALGRIAGAHGMMLEIVEPALVKAFNASREQIGDTTCWFVVVERGIAGIGLIEQGGWRGVATRRLNHPIEENLAQIIATEQQVIGMETPIDKAFVARYCFKHTFPAALSGLKIENLPDCGLVTA